MSTSKVIDAVLSESDHFTREDLIGVGDVAMTLADPAVTEEDVLQPWNNQTKRRKVLHFVETARTLVINSGNRKRLIHIMGTNKSSQWKGRRVVLSYDPKVKAAKGNTPGGIVIKEGKENEQR